MDLALCIQSTAGQLHMITLLCSCPFSTDNTP